MKRSALLRVWGLLPRRRDHYYLLVDYLQKAGLLGFGRLAMVAVLLLIGLVPSVMLYSPLGPQSRFARVASVVITCCAFGLAALWTRRWPGRWQSVVFAAASTACIVFATEMVSDPRAALLGCAAFAAVAGYVAFFHTTFHMALMLATAMATILVHALRIAETGDVAVAVAGSVVLMVALLCMPVSALLLVHLLVADARRSDADPLTGLYNHRGFFKALDSMVVEATDDSAHLMITVVDLDGFKSVNDAHGHVMGDRLLAAVATAIEDAGGDDAIVARTGGDEFLVARLVSPYDVSATAGAIRRSASGTPYPVTASVGVSSVPVAAMRDARLRDVYELLIDAADAAMYEAKRAGGDGWRASGRLRRPPRRKGVVRPPT